MELRSGIPNQDNNLPPLSSIPNQESIEYIPKWKQVQDDLRYLFGITIESEQSLTTEETKVLLYKTACNGIMAGEYFSLDYMFEEGLLTKEDIQKQEVSKLKPYALSILNNLRSIGQYNQAKNLFIDTGILTNEEIPQINLH